MNDLDKKLIELEMKRLDVKYAEELELTYDYIYWLFKEYWVEEYANLFYDSSPKECNDCTIDGCDGCEIWDKWHLSEKQLSFNNWVDVWGRGIWDESQQSVDNRVKQIFLNILDDEDLEYRLWIFERDGKKWIYYYDRDRFSDYWFIFRRK